MILKARLTSASLKQLANELTNYKDDLCYKVKLFGSRLADKGIRVAMSANSGSYAPYIVFSREDTENGSIIVARETTQLASDWLGHDDVYISPLLMTEFGAGNYAVYWENSDASETKVLNDGTPIGRGSFPNQTNAFKDHWFYRDKQTTLHITRGWMPTRPLHQAVIEMITQVEQTAREVFGNG